VQGNDAIKGGFFVNGLGAGGRDFATIERTYQAMQGWLPISNPSSIATSTGCAPTGRPAGPRSNRQRRQRSGDSARVRVPKREE
jgi:hypothetical protein